VPLRYDYVLGVILFDVYIQVLLIQMLLVQMLLVQMLLHVDLCRMMRHHHRMTLAMK